MFTVYFWSYGYMVKTKNGRGCVSKASMLPTLAMLTRWDLANNVYIFITLSFASLQAFLSTSHLSICPIKNKNAPPPQTKILLQWQHISLQKKMLNISWCKYTLCVDDVCTYVGGPTVLLKVDKCVQGSARPPCLVVDCHTTAGLSLSPPPAPASSSASHSLSAAQTDKQWTREGLYPSINLYTHTSCAGPWGGLLYWNGKTI